MLRDDGPLDDVPAEYATLDHPVWAEIAPRPGKGGFLPSEFESPELMDVGFLRLLYAARQWAGVPFRILDTVRGDPRSAHGELPCAAVDLQLLTSYERGRINRACITVGFVRIGIYPGTDGSYLGKRKKDGGGFHVDGSRSKPAACWTRGIQRTNL